MEGRWDGVHLQVPAELGWGGRDEGFQVGPMGEDMGALGAWMKVRGNIPMG